MPYAERKRCCAKTCPQGYYALTANLPASKHNFQYCKEANTSIGWKPKGCSLGYRRPSFNKKCEFIGCPSGFEESLADVPFAKVRCVPKGLPDVISQCSDFDNIAQ